jgi:hypothetical protein
MRCSMKYIVGIGVDYNSLFNLILCEKNSLSYVNVECQTASSSASAL